MSWQPELEELRARERLARAMGGAEKVRRQHEAGRLTVRERIARLLDPGSFHEIGALAGRATYGEDGALAEFVPANCVIGRGRIEGRPVVVTGDDFTVRGGSADATIPEKTLLAEQMAAEMRVPILRVIEGSGGGGSVKTIETTGRANLPGGLGRSTLVFHYTTANLAAVPVVALGLGSVAGLGAARLAASHFSVMTKSSAVFVAGPPVVARLGGSHERETLDKEVLGGWEIQTGCGAVDHVVESEEAAFAAARRFLSYLPASVHELPPRAVPHDDPARREEMLLAAIPRDRRAAYMMRPILDAVFDRGSVFEIGKLFGRSVITALARLDGFPVAVLASDPCFHAGCWTADACQKVVRFVDLAETFHLPVVYLVDCPGFQIGPEAERTATIRHGVRAMAAVNQSTVPWCSVIVRNAFGVAGAVHQPAGRFSQRHAWLSAFWGSLPLEGGIEAAYRADLDAAEDRVAKLAEIEARLERLRSPMRTAEAFWVEELIDPRDTRRLLCDFAAQTRTQLRPEPARLEMRP